MEGVAKPAQEGVEQETQGAAKPAQEGVEQETQGAREVAPRMRNG